MSAWDAPLTLFGRAGIVVVSDWIFVFFVSALAMKVGGGSFLGGASWLGECMIGTQQLDAEIERALSAWNTNDPGFRQIVDGLESRRIETPELIALRGLAAFSDDVEEATLWLREAFDQGVRWREVEIALGRGLLSLNHLKSAERVLRRCCSHYPPHDEGHRLLAEVLERRGHLEEAALVDGAVLDAGHWEERLAAMRAEYPDVMRVLENAERWEFASDEEIASLRIPHANIIRDLRRDRACWNELPSTPFNDNGFEFVGQMLGSAECQRLVGLTQSLMQDRSYRVNDTVYYIRRTDLVHAGDHKVYDHKTCTLFNLQDIDSHLGKLFHSGEIQRICEEKMGRRLLPMTFSVYISEPEGMHRQPLHVDGYTSTYKLFIYLNDVESPEQGPFSLVPGSHRHVMRRWKARVLNDIHGLQYAQMETEYDFLEARPMVAQRGGGLLASVSTAHSGWPFHRTGTRYVLVCYLTEDLEWRGPFTHGLGHITG